MRRFLTWISVSCVALLIQAQVPQFSSSEYAGWIYSNPIIELNQSNILANRIVLYTTSTGQHLTLTSPEFPCFGGQVITMNVTWITDQWKEPGFDMSKVALTASLLNDGGVTVDSVTYNLTSVSKTNHLTLSITVPKGLTKTRLRFASWKADVNNSGAVYKIVTSSALKGDVNLDGEVSIADVNAVINVILGGQAPDDLVKRADVNGDGEVTVNDANEVIDLIVG